MTPRLNGQNCKLFTTPFSRNSQKKLKHKENQTKYTNMTRKPRSHVRILTYRMWAICMRPQRTQLCRETSLKRLGRVILICCFPTMTFSDKNATTTTTNRIHYSILLSIFAYLPGSNLSFIFL